MTGKSVCDLSRNGQVNTVTCIEADALCLGETLEQFANEQWLPAHVTREEAAEIVLDQLKRTFARTLELLTLIAEGSAG